MLRGYQIPILMYHQVLRSRAEAGRFDTWVPERQLRRQLAYLRQNGYRTTTFRELDTLGELGERRIILTFDDGYEDNYTTLYPLLAEFGFTAVVFMVTRMASNAWDVVQGEPERRLMTAAQAREMAAGGVEFGGHTRTHVNFDLVSPKVAREEIAGCKADLEDWLGRPAVSFAYPYGAIHPHVKQMVAEAGFRFGVATKSGPALVEADRLQVRRIAISHRTSAAAFMLKVSGGYHQPLHGLPRLLGLGR